MIKAGEKLKEERLQKGLSLEDVSKRTKIKESFLEALENGEYEKLPSVSYAQGFFRSYARFLNLPEKEVMAVFRREFDEEEVYRVLPKGFEKTEEFPISRFRLRNTTLGIIFLLVVFAGYLLFQYRYAFINPPLSLNSPKDNAVVKTSQVLVSGKTDSNSTVYVNQDQVSVDREGKFEKKINVFPGEVTITVRVVNKFLKETTKKISINVEGS